MDSATQYQCRYVITRNVIGSSFYKHFRRKDYHVSGLQWFSFSQICFIPCPAASHSKTCCLSFFSSPPPHFPLCPSIRSLSRPLWHVNDSRCLCRCTACSTNPVAQFHRQFLSLLMTKTSFLLWLWLGADRPNERQSRRRDTRLVHDERSETRFHRGIVEHRCEADYVSVHLLFLASLQATLIFPFADDSLLLSFHHFCPLTLLFR